MLQIEVFCFTFFWRARELIIYEDRGSEMTGASLRSSLGLGRLFPGGLGATLPCEVRGEAAKGEICQLGGCLWVEHPGLQ